MLEVFQHFVLDFDQTFPNLPHISGRFVITKTICESEAVSRSVYHVPLLGPHLTLLIFSAGPVHRRGHFGCHPAPGRHEGLQDDCGHQQGPGGAHLPGMCNQRPRIHEQKNSKV